MKFQQSQKYMFQIKTTLDQREQERLWAQETINENYQKTIISYY